MCPDRLSFLTEFDRFYQDLVKDIKEGRFNERDFYLIIGAKSKSMNRKRRERRERKVLLNKKAKLKQIKGIESR